MARQRDKIDLALYDSTLHDDRLQDTSNMFTNPAFSMPKEQVALHETLREIAGLQKINLDSLKISMIPQFISEDSLMNPTLFESSSVVAAVKAKQAFLSRNSQAIIPYSTLATSNILQQSEFDTLVSDAAFKLKKEQIQDNMVYADGIEAAREILDSQQSEGFDILNMPIPVLTEATEVSDPLVAWDPTQKNMKSWNPISGKIKRITFDDNFVYLQNGENAPLNRPYIVAVRGDKFKLKHFVNLLQFIIDEPVIRIEWDESKVSKNYYFVRIIISLSK